MNANELADLLETNNFLNPTATKEAATMLRQQQAEIEALKEQIEDCTCQGGHSEAYLIAKGRVQKK